MKKRHNWGLPLLTALVTLGIWEGAVRLFDISLYILPAPSDVLMAVIENFQELMYHASVTLSEAADRTGGCRPCWPSSWRS